MKTENRIGLGLLVFFLLLQAPSVVAQEPAREFHPTGFVDLAAGNMAKFDANISIGDNYTGFVPEFTLQIGTGDLAVGLDWGFSVADVDNVDADIFVGGFVINLKGRHCWEGTWKTCVGSEFEIGINPFEVDPGGESASGAIGLLSHMMRWSRFSSKVITIDPLLALNTSDGQFFLQFTLGPSILIPYSDDQFDRDDAEVCLLYGLEGGVVISDLVGAGLGFKGLSTLSFDDNETFMALDFSLRLFLDRFTPVFRLSVPLTGDYYKDFVDIVITLGIWADF
ncbi:MAG: hypothetical protein JRJ87_08995 [Deltaproteobacteria bacterium]|nr:hypothetical protein [Deltaproteobacteria bacterium]